MKDRIKVVFFGKEYSVLTDAEKSYLMKIVDYLEQKITKAAEGNAPVTVPTPVFLASLEIVDDSSHCRGNLMSSREPRKEKQKSWSDCSNHPEAKRNRPY